MSNEIQTRRSALRLALHGAAVASLTEVMPASAWADDVPVERAAVCIYLIGGNDSNNMIVPLDSDRYGAYSAARGPLALSQSILLPVSASRQGGGFGFHPFLIEVRDLYARGSLAVLANTGALQRPTTRARVAAHADLPDGLMQHERSAYVRYLPNAVMMPPWAPSSQEEDPHDPLTQVYSLGGVSFLSPQRLHLSGPPADNPAIIHELRKTKLRTVFPRTQLGSQLERIARVLQASPKLGLRQPVFSASMGGFDTHANQWDKQEQLFRDLSQALGAFSSATEELGLADQVVTYTQTEFNRTLRPNATLGTDHGWGGHELIMGGAVRGGDIYGTFPSLQLGGEDDAGNDGVWIPSTSNQQYEAAVAYWHGIGSGDLSSALQGLDNFPAGNLGFLG